LNRGYFGEGLTFFGGSLYQLTYREHAAFKYNLSFDTQTTFSNPRPEGWGITHDGNQLIMSDGSSSLSFLDPETFSVTNTVAVKLAGQQVTNINELEYINGMVWANVWLSNTIVIIDPLSGNVKATLDLAALPRSGDVLNGIAYDSKNNRLFVTGKYWPTLYQIALNDSSILHNDSTTGFPVPSDTTNNAESFIFTFSESMTFSPQLWFIIVAHLVVCKIL